MVEGYITGFGFYVDKKSPLSTMDVFRASAIDAMRTAGIDAGDVDGIIFTTVPGTVDSVEFGTFMANRIANYLGITKLRVNDYVYMGGASIVVALHRAVRMVKEGVAENILVVGGGKGTLARRLRRNVEESLIKFYIEEGNVYNEMPNPTLEFPPVSEYALIATRYCHQYGVPDEGRAMVAVRERENANLNPNALFRGSITVKDVLDSPMVSYPLRLLETTMPVDGSISMIVSRNAGRSSINPIRVLGYGEGHEPRPLLEREDILTTPVRIGAKLALEAANAKIHDMDYLGVYDAFTIMAIMEVEGLGLAREGEGWRFFVDNETGPNSEHPLNTNGGSLNMGQPGFTSSGVVLAEALTQLAGLAGERQVKDARLALVNVLGGIFNHSVTIVLGV
jgi:acetyl-CoA acetyltransferase